MNEVTDFIELINTRTPLVLVETQEEQHVVELLKAVSAKKRLPLYIWSVTSGMYLHGEPRPENSYRDPSELLYYLWEMGFSGMFALLDFHPYLSNPRHVRLLKEIALKAQRNRQTLILISYRIDLPGELDFCSARFTLQLPDEKKLFSLVRKTAAEWSEENGGRRIQADQKALQLLVQNMKGLSATDVKRLTRNALRDRAITHEDIPEVARAKYELLNSNEVLMFEPDTAHLSQVGGLERLKKWLETRRAIFTADVQPPGLDLPKGVLLLGVQGSGKSLAAKAVAGTWGVPLLRMDFGVLYNKFYGETERRTREALKLAETMAPCVLWLDEIEKGVAGGDSDGGTSRRVLGTLLTWMAERKSAVFFVATANDISSLPPELLRKGRFDEIFFVDLPDGKTREAIFRIHLGKRRLDSRDFDLAELATAAAGFSGAEIEQSIIAGLYSVIGKSGTLTQAHLLREIQATSPLSKIMAEDISTLRAWASGRTVPAH